MDLHEDWTEIRHLFAHARFTSIATTTPDGQPHITPIGSVLMLRQPGRAVYFERFTKTLPSHLERDTRFCAMAVDMRLRLWAGALLRGRFRTAPATRLYGVAGDRRAATDEEMASLDRRFRFARGTRGYEKLWSKLDTVRELTFDRVVPVRIGRMWPAG